MKNILTVLFLVAISLSVFACDGDDGERGVAGLTGPTGMTGDKGDGGVPGVPGGKGSPGSDASLPDCHKNPNHHSCTLHNHPSLEQVINGMDLADFNLTDDGPTGFTADQKELWIKNADFSSVVSLTTIAFDEKNVVSRCTFSFTFGAADVKCV